MELILKPTVRYLVSLIALFSALNLSGCYKSSDGGSGIDLNNVRGDQFSNSDRSSKVSYLKNLLNLNIVIEDSSYSSEFAIDRVLRYLDANFDSIKGAFNDVIELHIGQYFERKEISQGKLSISLSYLASEKALGNFLKNVQETFVVDSSLTQFAIRIGISGITDSVGMSCEQAHAFGENLQTAAAGYDFTLPYASSMISRVVADHLFAIGAGYIIVPFDATAGDLQNFIGETLQLGKHLSTDLSNLSSTLGVGVNFQDGVLTPVEISKGLTNLKENADLFTNSVRSKVSVLLGRRTETDASAVRRASVLLIAFDASRAEIQSALELLDLDLTSAIHPYFDTFKTAYNLAGVAVSFSESDLANIFGRSENSISLVKNLLDQVEQIAAPSRLNGLHITSISYSNGYTDSTVTTQYDGSAVLVVALNNFKAASLDSVLANYTLTYNQNRRIENQRQILADLASSYNGSGIDIEYSTSDLDGSSADSEPALQQTILFFKRVAPGDRLKRLGISYVTFAKGALSVGESVIISGNSLRIDPYLATETLLESILKKDEPAPSPTPQPKPVPTPVPSK